MIRLFGSFLSLLLFLPMAFAENPTLCGTVPEGHVDTIPEWPNEPVDFRCNRGFSELTLCILNRKGVETLPNAGAQFIAVYDGDAVYAITRETHPAYPMIVKRKPVEVDGSVSIQTQGCGYGDKAASDALIEQYKAMDRRTLEEPLK